MRVCLVGEPYVGKTTICKQMLGLNNTSEPTIGLDFYSITHKTQQIELWDTAGEERYRSLLPIYLRKAKIIIYVISATNLQNEDYHYWNKYIHNNSDKNYKIIIVVTKCDLFKNYHFHMVYLKNFFKNEPIIFKFNDNITNKLLDQIIDIHTLQKKNITNNISEKYIDINKHNHDDFMYNILHDPKNNKSKCCF